jgi:threonine/homoserine/homoserine lactone efflux protein
VALFTIALLPQFTDPQAGNLAFQVPVLGACFVALAIAVDGTVGILAQGMPAATSTSPPDPSTSD